LWHACPQDRVHEQIELFLPDLPARATALDIAARTVSGRRDQRIRALRP
jgi:hypothetical protein